MSFFFSDEDWPATTYTHCEFCKRQHVGFRYNGTLRSCGRKKCEAAESAMWAKLHRMAFEAGRAWASMDHRKLLSALSGSRDESELLE